MTPILIFMAVIVAVAVLALAYAAFPHRGAPVPGASWLGDVLERAADAVPVLRDGDLDPVGTPSDGPDEPSTGGSLVGSLDRSHGESYGGGRPSRR